MVVACARVAQAQAEAPDSTLIVQGEALARAGEFSRAIVAFKQADTLHATAANACRIGLAYTRRELWSQAELFFSRCKTRATAADPTPPWFDEAQTKLTQKLAEIEAASVSIRVDAPGATISISSFPPDEEFTPQAIHLSPGSYTIAAHAPDREPASVAVTVDGRTAQIVMLAMRRPPPPPPPPPTIAQNIGRVLLYGGVGVALLAAGSHALAGYERSQLDSARAADDPVAWDRHAGSYETTRALAITGYAVAATSFVVGAILRRHGPMLTTTVEAHGATVGLAWQR